MPGTMNRTRPHRRLSSNNSLLRHNNRARMFSRSMSDNGGSNGGGSNSPRGPNSPHGAGSSSPRSGQRAGAGGNNGQSTTSGADNVFFDGPPTIPGGQTVEQVIHEEAPASREGIPGAYQQQGTDGVEDVSSRLLSGSNIGRSVSDVGPRRDTNH